MKFDDYFQSIYGERWPNLRQALVSEPKKVLLKNPFGSEWEDYSVDEASLLPPQMLAVQPGEKVADFCSAPGGKLLSMVFRLGVEAKTCEFSAFDLSPARIQRLKAVLHDCLPTDIVHGIRVTKFDSSRIGMRGSDQFDRILVDAPCSAERHMLQTVGEVERWSLKGVKRLQVRQHALICSALDSLKSGGRLVYSTCSISPLENDAVLEKLLKSRKGQWRSLKGTEEFKMGEPTTYGQLILPDRGGSGPIYSAALEKI